MVEPTWESEPINSLERRPRSGLVHVWGTPDYRALLAVNVLAGVSVSSYVPMISLFLVDTLGVDDPTVGLFMLTFLAAPVVGIAMGRLSDRLAGRLPLIVAVGIWVALGRVAMSLVPGFGAAVLVAIAFGAFSGVVNAQAFAVLRDTLDRRREIREATVASVVRTGYSFGWVVGPVLGGVAAAQLGYRAAIAASAVIALAALVPLWAVRGARRPQAIGSDARAARDHRSGPAGGRRSWGRSGLWIFAAASLLALTAEAIRLTYLPILAVDRLGVSLAVFGVLLALAPAVELVAMPVAGALADRWGMRPMLVVGFGLGAAGSAAFATSSSLGGLVAGQALNAAFIAVMLGLGATYAQQQHPSGAGFATSVFFGAQSLSVATGGLIGGGSAAVLGLPTMFLVPAALCVAGGLLLLATPHPPSSAE